MAESHRETHFQYIFTKNAVARVCVIGELFVSITIALLSSPSTYGIFVVSYWFTVTLGATSFSCAVAFSRGFAARVFGIRPKTSRPVADEALRRTREKTFDTQGTKP